MGLSIKNEATERRVRALAALTGEGITTAIDRAVAERLERLQRGLPVDDEAMTRVLLCLDAMPVLDDRPVHDLFEDLYDNDGLPT